MIFDCKKTQNTHRAVLERFFATKPKTELDIKPINSTDFRTANGLILYH